MEDTVSVEDLSGVQKRISILVSPDSVNKKFNEFFIGIQKETSVNGFRKGKVPLSILRQRFGERAKSLVSQMIVSEFYGKALKDYNLNPLGSPNIENNKDGVGKFNTDNSYFVSLLIEVLPKFTPEGYKGIELQLPKHNKEALIEEKLLEYRTQFAERKQITDRSAQINDSVVIDFRGFVDGSPFDGGAATGYSLNKLGSNTFIPGFEDQVVGMNAGEEKIISVKFPEQYHAINLADKDANFEVKLHTIVETKLAEVNNDLAMMIGFSSIEELLNKVNTEVDEYIEKSTKATLESQIISKLLATNNFDVPKSMVENEKRRLLGQNRNIPPNLEQSIANTAKLNVQRAILLDTIYEAESEIEVTPDELDKLLANYASQHNISKDDLVSNLYNSNQMDAFIGILRSQKAVDFVIQNAKKNEGE